MKTLNLPELSRFRVYEFDTSKYFLEEFLKIEIDIPNAAKKGWNKAKKAFGNKSPKKPKKRIRIKNPIKELRIDGKQLGKKFGKHKKDYPNMDYKAYQNYAKQIFSSPDKILKDNLKGEIYYIKGNDLLRVKNNGDFVSLYPGVQSKRVQSLIKK